MSDQLAEEHRNILNYKRQIEENDLMMAKFADEIKQLDITVDQKRKEQD